MMAQVMHLPEPPFCKKEALRYAGADAGGDAVLLLESAFEEARNCLQYQACFLEFPLHIAGNDCDLTFAKVHSRSLARHLAACGGILIMGATIGLGMDRLIEKYGKLSPARMLMLQAIGTERIEALCDAFCLQMNKSMETRGLYLRPRFSPGYGDTPLGLQKDIFRALDPERKIGLTLNDSLIMSPSKSVTAIIGLSKEQGKAPSIPCRQCGQQDCPYRRNV